MSLSTYYADLHIHIGRDHHGNPVKITGSKTLTLTNILQEANHRKGIDLVGVIDCHAPAVQQEIEQLIGEGSAYELEGGGIRFKDVTLLLGSEIEIYDENCRGPIHVLCFLPTLIKMKQFTGWLSERMTNINLSSQRYYGTAKQLQYKTKELGGLFIPAHVFTPFKSLYGKGVEQSLAEVLDADLVDAIELGLSSDTPMADQISELHNYTFLTNSDAHSLAKIAREYQAITMEHPSFTEFEYAIHNVDGRCIDANYGLHPLLGKYYSTVCSSCLSAVGENQACQNCGSVSSVKGVSDRIQELKDTNQPSSARPPYMYQVPLEYIPTLGPKTLNNLLAALGTEMYVLHKATPAELKKVVSNKIAEAICSMREGNFDIDAGGGGKYGKIQYSINVEPK
ncbi:endonuclease Q family protein [Radiobacillus sp. PE A8.2]|uniref:endonuclease Q family protein n=1 Tax=Radiobacillus sp. PE A8.2 TaxID=3380349 RepID=UPI00388D6EB9